MAAAVFATYPKIPGTTGNKGATTPKLLSSHVLTVMLKSLRFFLLVLLQSIRRRSYQNSRMNTIAIVCSSQPRLDFLCARTDNTGGASAQVSALEAGT